MTKDPSDTTEVEALLKELGMRYQKSELGYIMVMDSIEWVNRGLTELPDLSSVHVVGWMNCSGNPLRSLKGMPRSLTASVDFSDCMLENLDGAPDIVVGDFNVSGNKLTTLEGTLRICRGTLDCSRNLLTSLKGAPELIQGSLNCADNLLESLDGAPKEIAWEMDCRGNPSLVNLEQAPATFEVMYTDSDDFTPADLAARRTALARVVTEATVAQQPVRIGRPLTFRRPA